MKKILLGASLFIALIGGAFYATQRAPQISGAFNPVGGTTYYLQSSIGLTNTTITLSSFKNRSGIPLTMSLLNTDIIYGTLDPQSTRSEFISFTGITQNSNGTATLTGVVRGLSDIYPYTASSTMVQSHPGQSVFIISNTPQFQNEYVAKRNNETISGIWTFSSTSPPRLDSPAAQASGSYIATTSEFVTWAGLMAVTNAGTVNATETVKGIAQFSTKLQQAASTILGSTGAGLILQAQYATSTPTPGVLSQNVVPVTNTSGTLNVNFIGTSTADKYTFANATSTIFGVGKLNLNTWPFIFNGSNTATNTVIKGDGVGNYSLGNPDNQFSVTSATDVAASNGYATSSLVTIPSWFPTASTTIEVDANLLCATSGGNGSTCAYYLRIGTGATLVSISFDTGSAPKTNMVYPIRIVVGGSSSFTTAQVSTLSGLQIEGTAVLNSLTAENTTSLNLSGAFTVGLVAQGGNANYTATISNYSIRVRR